jgi:hypothetical protein
VFFKLPPELPRFESLLDLLSDRKDWTASLYLFSSFKFLILQHGASSRNQLPSCSESIQATKVLMRLEEHPLVDHHLDVRGFDRTGALDIRQ